MDCSTTGLPVHPRLPGFTQTHVHWVGDAIQPSHPLSAPSPPALNLSQHESFPVSWLFASGDPSTEASPSGSVSLMNIQAWFPSGLTGLVSVPSEGLSRVFSNTTVWTYQFFGAQPSLWSNSHICMWLLKKIMALTIWTWLLSAKVRAEIDHRRLLWDSRQNTVVDLGSSHWN